MERNTCDEKKKEHKKRILCIVSTMLLTFSVNTPITVSAFQLPDAIKDYVDLRTDGDLKDIIQNADISEEFSIIEQVIMGIMESDWYKDTDIQSRKEKITEFRVIFRHFLRIYYRSFHTLLNLYEGRKIKIERKEDIIKAHRQKIREI